MSLKNLSLYDFRNYTDRHFEFDEKVVFYGQNGRGKTNILESISVLSVGKSWRETSGKDLILNEAESAMIRGKMNDENHYQVQIQPRSRSFTKNEKKISLKQHFGQIPTLLFAPEHLGLFSGTKSGRQRYFDRFLAQTSHSYRDNLMRCERARKQKNAILKSITSPKEKGGHEHEKLFSMQSERTGDDIDHASRGISRTNINVQLHPWNEILAQTIPLIWNERQDFIQKLNPILQTELNKISGNSDSINMKLESPEEFEPTSEGILDYFEKNEWREIAAKRSLLGPQRDDFVFYLRDKPISSSASRGEERSVLLALLSAKKKILQTVLKDSPILLLDDVFSELDSDRQTHLEQICEGSQVFFTTTHAEHFANFFGEVQRVEIV